MSILDRLRPDRVDTSPAGTDPVGPVGAALTGMWAAGLSLLGIALPVLLAWAASGHTSATWGQALRVSADGWLLLHHVALAVPGGQLSVAPLALSALPAVACWLAGRRVALGHPDHHLVPGVRRPGAPSPRALVAPVAAMSAGYGVVVAAAAVLARGDGVQPVVWQAVLAGFGVPALVGGTSALRAERTAPAAVLADLLGLPGRIRRCVRPAAMAMAGLVALGALSVVVALLVEHQRVLSLHQALDPGVVGGAVLTAGQVGVLPNLVLSAVAWLAGPGFAMGVGTSVTPTGSTLGLLPLVPILGALPSAGALPGVLSAVVALPVLVGAGAGWFVAARQQPPGAGLRDVVTDALTAAALAALGMGLALALAGGSAGPGRLAAVGPSPWQVGLVLAAELAVGAAAASWATHRFRRR